MKLNKKKDEPHVHLSIEDCIFEIEGDSYSEEVNLVYEKISNWIDENLQKCVCELTCNFRLFVINSITYKSLIEVMSKISEHQKSGIKINVNWYYDKNDEDMLFFAGDFRQLCDLHINTIAND